MSPVRHYPTDITEEQWELLRPLLPQPKWHPGGPGRPPYELRRVRNGIFYVTKSGCQWRMVPFDFGHWHTL
jgi:putative transposase